MWSPPWLRQPDPHALQRYRHRWWALVFICLASLIGSMEATILNVALPSISAAMDASVSDLQWVVDAYNLTLAGFVLLGGGLADRYGRKEMFLAGLALFALASLGAAYSSTPLELSGYRAAMGLGAALLFPAALSSIGVMFAPKERTRAVVAWASVGALGLALGPLLDGVLLNWFWWGSVLLINVPVAVIAFVGIAVLMPKSRRPGAFPLDFFGAALSVAGLGGLVFGLIQGPEFGWTSPVIVGALSVGLLATAGFFVWESHYRYPMFNPRVFKSRLVLAGSTTIFIAYFCQTGMLFLIPQYLVYTLNESVLMAGVTLLPFGAAFVITAQIVPRMARSLPIRSFMAGGLLVLATGLLVMSAAGVLGGYLLIAVGAIVFGAGLAWTLPRSTSTILNAVPVSQAGDASATYQIVRQTSAALSVALVGTVAAVTYQQQISVDVADLTNSQSSAASAYVDGALVLARAIGGPQGAALHDAAVAAFNASVSVGLMVAAAAACAAAAFILILLRKS